MEDIISEKTFKEIQYSILGRELQTINVILLPSQSINVEERNVVCTNEGITRNNIHRPFCGEQVEYASFIMQ
jgi:hypothetical protein